MSNASPEMDNSCQIYQHLPDRQQVTLTAVFYMQMLLYKCMSFFHPCMLRVGAQNSSCSAAFENSTAVQPSNLLLNSECLVKLADFGLARSVAQLRTELSPGCILTDYVATRWYRAPEILLGSAKYTTGVDMWSSGEVFCPCSMLMYCSRKGTIAGH